MQAETFSIGIDVGGTNTDAVFLATSDGAMNVRASVKTATSQDVVTGIRNALTQLLADDQLPKDKVQCVFLGTTKFLNALLECRSLLKVGVVRLCLPTTINHPPLIEWPEQLKNTVLRGSWLVHGGLEFYPQSEISALIDAEFADVATEVEAMEVGQRPAEIVISGVHAPLRVDQEERACRILERELEARGLQHIRVTSSCAAVGRRIGILKRESAAVLNACLRRSAAITVNAFNRALADAGLAHARAFLTTSDGTVVDGAGVLNRPVQCIASGPVNSIRGAGVLLNDQASTSIFVLDVGGTTTDVGVLIGAGAQRHVKESNSDSRVAGVRTNNRVADVLSIALGGGSIFRNTHFDTASVGYRIREDAICCGGTTPTFTDVALALRTDVDDAWATVRGAELRAALSAQTGATVEQMQAAYRAANQRVADLVSKLKTSAANDGVRVILAGGGGALLDRAMIAQMLGMGVEGVVTIPNGDVANACGAGVGQVGAELETTAEMAEGDEEAAVAELRERVRRMAAEAGGVLASAVVTQEEVAPIPFVQGSTRRVYLKAVADLDLAKAAAAGAAAAAAADVVVEEEERGAAEGAHVEAPDMFSPPQATEKQVDAAGVWSLSEYDIHCLAVGCGVLGSGGGGSTYKGFLSLKRMLREGKELKVVTTDKLPAAAHVLPAAFMGVPTVTEERVHVTGDLLRAGQKVLEMMGGIEAKETYLLSAEIGGTNGLELLVLQAQTGAFAGVVDGDLMGRAFPELQMQTLTINGLSVLPAAISDAHGRVVSIARRPGAVAAEEGGAPGSCPFERTKLDAAGVEVERGDAWCWEAKRPFANDAKFLEEELRPHLLFNTNPYQATAAAPPANPGMGMVAGLAFRALSAAEAQQGVIPGTLSLGRALGDAILRAHRQQSPVLAALQTVLPGAALLATGKVDVVDTDTARGFAEGRATIQSDDGARVQVQYQNEYLRCSRLEGEEVGATLGEVPALICVLDAENGAPIATEEIKYGLRVLVVSLPADPRLLTEQALAVVGPQAFESLSR